MRSAPRVGRVPASTPLAVTIGLPADLPALAAAVDQVSDPASASYRAFLAPEQFADRFGASPASYEAVLDWARAKNLAVVPHRNRLIVEVSGTVADIERAFAVELTLRLRPDGTQFYAPEAEPSLDLAVPVAHIGNLENFVVPRHADGGSGPGGSRQGSDFRHAYAACTTLTGAGQTVGILNWDGFSQSDVTSYFAAAGYGAGGSAGLPAPLTVEAVPAGSVGATAAVEGNLDVQMVLSMAPGAQVVAFNGSYDSMLANMADQPAIRTLSSSWFTVLDSSAIALLAQIALNGQTFFQASGDGGAYPIPYFLSAGTDPRQGAGVTVVGGTGLNMLNDGAAYGTEVAWPGSSGGILQYAGVEDEGGLVPVGTAIPSYQAGLANAANGASRFYRNLPDVSAEAWDVNIYYQGGSYQVGGTSAATPLWAGFLALVYDQATTERRTGDLGFINPLLYSLASNATTYAADFNDIQSGSNGAYSAVPGYDLVTGLGSPQCALITALAEEAACAPCLAGEILDEANCACISKPVCHTAIECCVEGGGVWMGGRCT